MAAWYQANRDRIIERTGEYQRANPGVARKSSAKWRKNNPEYLEANREKARQVTRQWVRDNPERKKATDKRYREAHPEVHARTRLKRRANPKDRPGKVEEEYILILYRDRCAFCSAPAVEVDHIEPRPRWNFQVLGWNRWENLAGLCRNCNRRKIDKTLLTFLLT